MKSLTAEQLAPVYELIRRCIIPDAEGDIHQAFIQHQADWFQQRNMRMWYACMKQVLRSYGFDDAFFGAPVHDTAHTLVEAVLNLR